MPSVLLSAACSGSATCSLVGARDHVEVDFDQGSVPSVREVTLTACAAARCATQTYRGGPHKLTVGPLGVFVPVPEDAMVEVHVKLKIGSRLVFTGSTATQTHKLQPNGPGCEPTVWFARVRAHQDGTLTAA